MLPVKWLFFLRVFECHHVYMLQRTKKSKYNILMIVSMRDFSFLSLNFIIIINNISLTHETSMPDIISPPTYDTSAIAYAQQ
jgi:hypothetical protein